MNHKLFQWTIQLISALFIWLLWTISLNPAVCQGVLPMNSQGSPSLVPCDGIIIKSIWDRKDQEWPEPPSSGISKLGKRTLLIIFSMQLPNVQFNRFGKRLHHAGKTGATQPHTKTVIAHLHSLSQNVCEVVNWISMKIQKAAWAPLKTVVEFWGLPAKMEASVDRLCLLTQPKEGQQQI